MTPEPKRRERKPRKIHMTLVIDQVCVDWLKDTSYDTRESMSGIVNALILEEIQAGKEVEK